MPIDKGIWGKSKLYPERSIEWWPLENYVLYDFGDRKVTKVTTIGVLTQDVAGKRTYITPISDKGMMMMDKQIPFECGSWPPTDDDIRRAQVVAVLHREG